MRRYLLSIIACGLLWGCGANDTFNPSLAGSGGDFTLTVRGATQQSVVAGNSVKFEFVATSVGNFSSPVTVSASGLPQGATGTFDNNPVVPSANGTDTHLTINTGGNLNGNIKSVHRGAGASRATYIITVTGAGGGRTHSTTVQLDVTLNGN